MKKYFFYSAGGQGIITLQFPQAADSFGVVKDPILYKIKLTPGTTIAGLNEGDLISEAALMIKLKATFVNVKVVVEENHGPKIYLLVDEVS